MQRADIRNTLNWFYNRLMPTLLALLALVSLWHLGQQLEPAAFDLLSRVAAKPVVQSPVTLILIDDASLARLKDRFGPIPWPRKVYPAIFAQIARSTPALMVFDGHFVNINEARDSAVFSAMKQFDNLITGLVMEEAPRGDVNTLNTQLPQYYKLNLGVVSMKEDPDGVIRSLKPVYQVPTRRSQTGIFPAMSLATAYEYLNLRHQENTWIMDMDHATQPPQLKLYPETSPKTGIRLPLSSGEGFYLRWHRLLASDAFEYHHSHPAIPLWRFFDPQSPPPDLHGRIALIGASSTFYRDYHKTPMAHRHLGPDIHATAIDNILNNEAIRKASPLANLTILAFLSLLAINIRFRVRHFGRVLLYTLGAMIIYASVVFWVFSAQAYWLDLVTPELFMGIAFLAGSSFRIFVKEKQLAAMEKSLSQLVDPEVFREIQRRAHVLQPGGNKLEITSMFVDIRNFTTLAEYLQPAEVTELLNEFYSEIINVIFSHQGTLDKFMGDGILFIFGAPLPNEHHRQLAIQAANDILATTQRLSRRWLEMRNIATDIGISLNSGPAFVGFLGPEDKLQYTGVGDTVNICVRLQEHTKQFQTRLIMSETTLQGVPEALQQHIPPDQYVELGDVSVRGREGVIKIFTLRQALLNAQHNPE